MISTDKTTYSQVLSKHTLPIFFQDWYLDIVCGIDNWKPYQLLDENQNTYAVWIVSPKSKLNVNYVVGPQMTPYTGLFVIDKERDISLLLDEVRTQFHYIEQSVLPAMASYMSEKINEGVTYIIDGIQDEERAFANMKSDWRRKIRKANKVFVTKEVSFDVFQEILQRSFDKKEKPNPYPMNLFNIIDIACEDHKARSILGAFDQEGNIQGAAYFMFDTNSTYYMGGGHIDSQNSMYLLLWEGIKQSLSNSKNFDFEGSTIPGVARFFKGFGGDKIAYPIYCYSKAAWVTGLVKLRKKWGK